MPELKKTLDRRTRKAGASRPARVSRRAVPVAAGRQTQRRLGELARLAEALAGELAARDPHAQPRRAAARVAAWHAAARRLLRSLKAQRRQLLSSQLRRLGVTSRSRGLKLHLGAADRPLAGWINIDRWPAELAMDLRGRLPFGTGSAQAVYLCHVLEHFHYPDEALALLTEIRRLLAARGVVRIVVPDIGQTLRAYVAGDRRFFAARRAHWPWWPQPLSQLEAVLGYAGVGASPDAFGGHKFGYDFATLRALLRRAGFDHIVRSGYMRSRIRALRVDAESHVAGARAGRRFLSLFVEARRSGLH
jgi:predicted SAM-dependent methyltransferase